jgi:hypothetical protein
VPKRRIVSVTTRTSLHAENTTACSDMVAALDTIKSVEKDKNTASFEVTFAASSPRTAARLA